MRKSRMVEVIVVLGVLILLVVVFLQVLLRRPRETGGPDGRLWCLKNLKQHGLALAQYAQDFDGRYPWRVGAVNPGEAWKDLAMLFPGYNSSWESFICPSSRDRMFDPKCASGDKIDHPFEPLLPANNREVISYAYCFDARDPGNPKAWTEEAPGALRLMADKKAGYPVGHAKIPRLRRTTETTAGTFSITTGT